MDDEGENCTNKNRLHPTKRNREVNDQLGVL